MIINKSKLETVVRATRSTTINELLSEIKIDENRLCVFINENFYATLKHDHRIYRGDIVRITPELSGGGNGAKVATTLIGVGALVATGGIAGAGLGANLARAGILIGSQFVILGIQRFFGARQQNEQVEAQNTPQYGLDAGSNRARVLQPLPVVMGEIRVNPDISAKIYIEPVEDELVVYSNLNGDGVGTWSENVGGVTIDHTTFAGSGVVNVGGQDFQYDHRNASGTPDNWDRVIPASGSPYRNTQLEARNEPLASIGDRYDLTYVWITDSLINDPATREKYVSWQDLIDNGLGATFLDPTSGDELDGVLSYDFISFFTSYYTITRALKQIFNFGYGDLTLDQYRIGNTDADEYLEYNEYQNTETPTNYPLAQVEPNLLGSMPPTYTQQVNGNVYTVEGGELLGTTNPTPDNWIYRESPDGTFSFQVDVRGRQLRRNPNVIPTGAELLAREYEFEWSDDNVTWNSFSNAVEPQMATTGVVSVATFNEEYQNTLWENNLTPAKYYVRCRKVDPEETDINNICNMFVDQIRFYTTDENQLYEAQNRIGVTVKASSQLNGTLDTLSTRVRSKCWAWNGSTYDWDYTENPADWFLYFARGAYKNTSADGTFTYPFSPTVGWVNSADHPDNGEKLFGAGIEDAKIDFSSIQEWWDYCDTNNLTFNAIMTTKKTAKDILMDIARAGRGVPVKSLGKLGVAWEDPNDPVVAVFSPDNIIKDSFEVSYVNQKVPDRIIVEFINSAEGYEQDEVFADMPTVSNIVDVATFQLWGVVYEQEAQRQANLLVSRNLYHKRIIKFRTDAEGLIVSLGDVVSISHDMTQWGFSGRIKNMTITGGFVTSFQVDTFVDPLINEIHVRDVHNNINTYTVQVNNDWIQIDGSTPWPDTDAPQYYDQQGSENANSTMPDSWMDDFIFMAGFNSTGGKKARITEIQPISTNEVEITCSDEEEAYYAREFGGAYVPPEDYELIKAEVFNADYEILATSQKVYWEKTGADAVSIMIQVNGGGYNPLVVNGATIYSNYVEIFYSTGDVLDFIITPVVSGTPYESVDDTLTFVVP